MRGLLLSSVLTGAETTDRSGAVIVGLAAPDRTVKHCSSPFSPAPRAAILAPAVSSGASRSLRRPAGRGAFRRERRRLSVRRDGKSSRESRKPERRRSPTRRGGGKQSTSTSLYLSRFFGGISATFFTSARFHLSTSTALSILLFQCKLHWKNTRYCFF